MNTSDILKDIQNIPGIYKITNIINGKSYIGQSLYLKKRIRRHLSYKSHKDNLALYKAFDKYGVDKFIIEILETIDTEKCDNIKSELDILEIFYIKKYNSYISGYNKTIGGDAGITRYKFTEEQRRKVSEHQKLCAHNFYKPVYLKNIISGNIKNYISERHAAEDLKCSHSQISCVCNQKLYLLKNEWVGGRTKEEVNNNYIQFLQKGNKNGGKFIRKISIILYSFWICAIWYHLSHGFWSAMQTLGINGKIWFKRWKMIGLVYTTLLMLGFLIVVLAFTFGCAPSLHSACCLIH